MIGGNPENYIKLKEIEQNALGNKYAAAYIDDGKFRLRTFNKETRKPKEVKNNEFDINKALGGLDDYTMPIAGFPDPFIVCCFINDDLICVSLFHNKTLRHFHFIYSDSKKSIVGEPVIHNMDCTMKNFPYKVFYNDEENELYIFYR